MPTEAIAQGYHDCNTMYNALLQPCRAPVRQNVFRRNRGARQFATHCNHADRREAAPTESQESDQTRRKILSQIVAFSAVASALQAGDAEAIGFKKDLKRARRVKVPESEYKDGPDGLKIYDVKLGDGALAKVGSRVAVHYEARWRGVTFMTSRQGMGVTGGSPIGFDVGTDERYGTLPGLDLGVRGMRVGGQRKLLVPANLAYGDKGVGEIPGGATLEFDVELLSIKSSPIGSRVKLVEG